jgi:cytochrome c peroxidase
VEQGKFAITDAKTNRDIDLNREWKRCFRPGQHVNMSLFFDEVYSESKTTTCPSCHAQCPGGQDSEIEW